jgi:IS605 OrfB family transposase
VALKTIRLTSYFHNNEKFNKIQEIDSKIKFVKNNMSQFIHENIESLLSNKKEFLTNYKQFKIDDISAWETQSLFQDIIKLYENKIQKLNQNKDLFVQEEFKITFYKRATKRNKIGDVKEKVIIKKKTKLSKTIKYLSFCDFNEELPEKAKSLLEPYIEKGFSDRIVELAQKVKKRIINRLKVIEFQTGTYRKSTAENGKTKDSYIFKDETNRQFKWWYCYKIGKERIYLPLQINKKYHGELESVIRFKAECYIKVTKNKIDILTTRNFEGHSFNNFTDILGIDVNVKHNFCYLSDGIEIDYDRKWIGQAVKELKKHDSSRIKSEKQKQKIAKIARRNEWYFKKLISEILDQIVVNGYSDIVMEDLNLSFGATFIKHPDFDIKYSRLIKLLRLSNVKNWFIEQANKRGIRVHLTNPAYTSQTCPACGCISRENRKTQEQFECIDCGHTSNADHNSAINIKNRIFLDVLRNQLHNELEGTYSPKRQRKETIKTIVQTYYHCV